MAVEAKKHTTCKSSQPGREKTPVLQGRLIDYMAGTLKKK